MLHLRNYTTLEETYFLPIPSGILHVAVVFGHLYLQFLNLFVAIIIDNFDYLVKDKSVLGAHQLSTFVKLWSIYDPSARSVYYANYIRVLARGKGAMQCMYNPHLAKHICFCKAKRNERGKKKGEGGIKKEGKPPGLPALAKTPAT